MLLGFVWIPYVAVRCVDGAGHADCSVLTAANAADHHEHSTRAPSTNQHDHTAHGHGDPGKQAPGRTCCELTGKCNLKLTASAPSLEPALQIGPLSCKPYPVAAGRMAARLCPAEVAHGPPIFLRNATLLL